MAEEEMPQVYDGLPLIESATRLKDEGNGMVKKKMYNEAISCYENGIKTLDRGDGYPMLKDEVHQIVALKATLYCNMAQCLLSLELYRRAIEAATSCLALDEANVKALYRRSLAHEAVRSYKEAEADLVALQQAGGSSLTAEDFNKRLSSLREKIAEEARIKEEEEAEYDHDGEELVRMKERFDEIVEKYDLRDDDAASQVADWLVSGEWQVTVKRVADRWGMDLIDAADFLSWIAKGCEFQKQNAQNAAAAQAQAPMRDFSDD